MVGSVISVRPTCGRASTPPRSLSFGESELMPHISSE